MTSPEGKKVSRRNFVGGVVGAAVVAGAAGVAAGYYGRSPTASVSTTTESSTVTNVSTQTSASSSGGGTLHIGSAFPETGLFAGDGLSGIKSAQMALEDWMAIYGNLPNGHKDFKFTNIDVPDKNTQEASAAIQQLVTVHTVDFILTDYITVDATEEDKAAQYDVYYINHDITGLHERKVLLNDTYAGTYPATSDIKWQSFNGFPSYDQKIGASAYPQHKYWNVFMGVIHDEDYSLNLFANINGWINSGKWKPINKKYAIFTSAGAYGQRIGHTFETLMNLAGWKESLVQAVPGGTVEYGPILSKLAADPPAIIFDTDFAPSDEAAFLKQFMENPLPSLIFFQYGPSLPDFLPLAGQNAVGALFHECRGLLRNARGYDYEAHYWKRWNSAPALADSAQSQDFAWNSLIVQGIAGGTKGDSARRMSAILNSSVDADHSDYVTVGLGGPWSMRPGQCVRTWMEQNNREIPMGGPVVTYQVKARIGENPPADGARTTQHPYTQAGNVPTRIQIGSQAISKYWHDPDIMKLTGFQTNSNKYWSPLHQKVMEADPKAYYTSGHYPYSTDGVVPDFADEDFETPPYFAKVSQAILKNVTQ